MHILRKTVYDKSPVMCRVHCLCLCPHLKNNMQTTASAARVWNGLPHRHTSHRRRRYTSSKGIQRQSSSSAGVSPPPHRNKLNYCHRCTCVTCGR